MSSRASRASQRPPRAQGRPPFLVLYTRSRWKGWKIDGQGRGGNCRPVSRVLRSARIRHCGRLPMQARIVSVLLLALAASASAQQSNTASARASSAVATDAAAEVLAFEREMEAA